MEPDPTRPTANDADLWRFVPLDEAQVPASGSSAKLLHPILDSIRRAIPFLKAPTDGAARKLDDLSQDRLDSLVPDADSDATIVALDAALAHEEEQGERAGIHVVVAATHSGVQRSLLDWAQARGLHSLEPPSASALIAGDPVALDALCADGKPVVIPCLERWFVRGSGGLGVVRRLFDLLREPRVECYVGCDSWAWAYLQHVAELDDLRPITLAPLDGDALRQWLPSAAGGRVDFRQADDGSPIFGSARDDAARGERKHSSFVDELAAHARGIAPIAAAHWRASLRVAPDADSDADESSSATPARHTIWVRPWKLDSWPTIDRIASRDELFTLHAILVHGGIEPALLPYVTGLPLHESTRALHRLGASGIVTSNGGRAVTTPLGYPCARDALSSEGFMVDFP